MNDHPFGTRRAEPAPPGTTRYDPEQSNTQENNAISHASTEPEWITVPEAQEEFRALGLPRSPEAIRKYCRQGKLASEPISGPKGDQHMIQKASIGTFVTEQLKVLNAASRTIPVQPGTTRDDPAHASMTRNVPVRSDTTFELEEKTKELEEEIIKLKRENQELAIDKEVRSRMNQHLEQDRDRLIEQVGQVSREAQEWSRKYGQLEERVQHLKLTAPEGQGEPINPLGSEDVPQPSEVRDVGTV